MSLLHVSANAVEVPLSEMPKDFESALAYWTDKRGGRAFPSRADIDPIDFKNYLGRVTLVSVRDTAPRFTLRVVGSSHFFRKHGPRDGRDLMDIKPTEYASEVARQYEVTLERRRPTVFTTTLEFRGTAFSFTRLALPLGADTEVPDMLLAVVEFDATEQTTFFSRYEEELKRLAG